MGSPSNGVTTLPRPVCQQKRKYLEQAARWQAGRSPPGARAPSGEVQEENVTKVLQVRGAWTQHHLQGRN